MGVSPEAHSLAKTPNLHLARCPGSAWRLARRVKSAVGGN